MITLQVAAGIILGLGVFMLLLKINDLHSDYKMYKDQCDYFEKRYYKKCQEYNELEDKAARLIQKAGSNL